MIIFFIFVTLMSDSGVLLDARLSKGLKVLEGFFFYFFDSSDFTFIFL